MDAANRFEFRVPDSDVILILEKMNFPELESFAFVYYSKGEAFNHISGLVERVKKEGESLEDYEGYAKKLASIMAEQTKQALDLYRNLTQALRQRVRDTINSNGFDASTEEGWSAIFNTQTGESMQSLMNLTKEFLEAHKPSEKTLKNSNGASSSS